MPFSKHPQGCGGEKTGIELIPDEYHFTRVLFSPTIKTMNFENIVVFIINTFVGITEAMLGLRFFLKLLGASDRAPFVLWVYNTSGSLLEPFSNMFPSPSLGNLFVIEFTTIFAMIVYAACGFFVVRIFEFVYKQILVAISKPEHEEHHKKVTD